MAPGALMPHSSVPRFDDKHRCLLENCFHRETGSSVPLPGDDVDLLEEGILDSMGWVGFLRGVETGSGASDRGSNQNEHSASIAALLTAVGDTKYTPEPFALPASLDGLSQS